MQMLDNIHGRQLWTMNTSTVIAGVRASDSCRPYSEQDLKHLLCLYLVALVGKLFSSD
jgi:hypothetical protein